MENEKIDIRVIKTHRDIRNALIELLDETPFEKISVQDILERALVNRSTFYKYYSGKSDLAGKMIADFKTQYATFLKQRFDEGTDLPKLLASMPKTLFEFRRTMLALWKVNTKRHHLHQDMFEMIRQKYLAQTQKLGTAGDVEYQAHIIATIALSSAKYYLEQNKLIDFANIHREIRQVLDIMKHPD